jgi:hypothetical protein
VRAGASDPIPNTQYPPTIPPTEPPPPTAAPPSWYGAGTVALFSVGDQASGDLYALDHDGVTHLVLPGIGGGAAVSPDGRWLGFVRGETEDKPWIELHDAETGASREILTDTFVASTLNLAFDRGSRRLAYLYLGDLGESGVVPWALVVVDLERNTTAHYDAQMTREDRRSLPGMPVGWSSGDELVINTFMPYSGGGWAGVWGVTFPADGAPASLDTLSLRELLPGAPAYLSHLFLSPDGQNLAFLSRDPDYKPDNYLFEFYDLAVNRLETLALASGARTLLVRVDDGSALAHALAWSPAGDRLLFAQGRYEGGEQLGTLTLKSSDLDGAVVEHGPLTLPPSGTLADLAWCTASQVLYVAWDGTDYTQQLYSLDLTTALSTQLSRGEQINLITCAP